MMILSDDGGYGDDADNGNGQDGGLSKWRTYGFRETYEYEKSTQHSCHFLLTFWHCLSRNYEALTISGSPFL